MKMKITTFAKVLFLSILFATTSFPQVSVPGFDADYISVNSIKMWISNYGEGSHDPFTDGGGLYYPISSNPGKTLVFSDGLFWMGKIGNDLYASGNSKLSGVTPGTVENDSSTGFNKNKFRVYKIKPEWNKLPPGTKRDEFQTDFNEWPADIGAPFFDLDYDGKYNSAFDQPEIFGDEMLWTVFHDEPYAIFIVGPYIPETGMEIQSTVYAFNKTNLFNYVIFKKYKLINKGMQTIDSMYFSYYSDPDVGAPDNDYVGSDSALSLAYAYNASSTDTVYGSHPPAVGYALLQGPVIKSSIEDSAFSDNKIIAGYKNLDATSFQFSVAGYCPGRPCEDNSWEYWNHIRGLLWNGTPLINPITGKPTKFPLNGDPYRQTGWYEGDGWPDGLSPEDMQMMLNTGPFTMAPGDTQEVVYAILVGQGSSNTRSVEELKLMVPKLQYFHKNYLPPMPEMKEEKKQLDFKLTQNYPNPFNSSTIVHYQIPLDSRVTVKVFDVLGNEVAVLKDEYQNAGDYDAVFNAENLASGLYILNISAREFFSSKKMILLR